jgi:hypothetical protein
VTSRITCVPPGRIAGSRFGPPYLSSQDTFAAATSSSPMFGLGAITATDGTAPFANASRSYSSSIAIRSSDQRYSSTTPTPITG